MSCENCGTSAKGQAEALNNIRKQAKDYAVEKEITVAIYKEGYEYRFIEYSAALASGYYIVGVVSKYN